LQESPLDCPEEPGAISVEAYYSLDFLGFPSQVSAAALECLETSFVTASTQVSPCSYANMDVSILPAAIDGYGNDDASTVATIFIARGFSFLVSARAQQCRPSGSGRNLQGMPSRNCEHLCPSISDDCLLIKLEGVGQSRRRTVNTCYCHADAIASRGPSEVEFIQAFQQIVEESLDLLCLSSISTCDYSSSFETALVVAFGIEDSDPNQFQADMEAAFLSALNVVELPLYYRCLATARYHEFLFSCLSKNLPLNTKPAIQAVTSASASESSGSFLSTRFAQSRRRNDEQEILAPPHSRCLSGPSQDSLSSSLDNAPSDSESLDVLACREDASITILAKLTAVAEPPPPLAADYRCRHRCYHSIPLPATATAASFAAVTTATNYRSLPLTATATSFCQLPTTAASTC
jgi:hypothetical protein